MERVKLLCAEEVGVLLAHNIFLILCGRLAVKFPKSGNGKPSPFVLIGKIKVEVDQYHLCVLPVLNNEELKILRTPRSREFLKDPTSTNLYISRIGEYLMKSFSENGF